MNLYEEYPSELYHYGVKGMRWGVRRYTNADGSLNAKGVKKYARAGYAQDSYNSNRTKLGRAYDKITGAHKYSGDMMYNTSSAKANKARAEKYVADKEAAKAAKNTPEAKAKRRDQMKTAAKIGAVAAGTALAAYGAYKLNKYVMGENAKLRQSQGKDFAENFMNITGKHLSARTYMSNSKVAPGLDKAFREGADAIYKYDYDTARGLTNKYMLALSKDTKTKDTLNVVKKSQELGEHWLKMTRSGGGRMNQIGIRDMAYKDYMDLHSKDSFITAAKNLYDNRKKR